MRARFRFPALVLVVSAAAFADDGASGTGGKDAAKDSKGGAPAASKDGEGGSARKAGAASDAGKPAAAKAAPAAAVPVVAAPRTLDEALRILGRRRVDVTFRETPLDEVVTFVAKLGGLNAMVSPEFRSKSGASLPTVTLELRRVTLRQVAEMSAKASGSALALRDGILQFTTPEDARGKPVLRIFSIADLTFRIRNFPGPDIQIHLAGAEFVPEEESDQPSAFDDPEKVVEMIRKFTGEGTWDDADVSVSADDRRLIVRQYPAVLKEISALLAVLRAAK